MVIDDNIIYLTRLAKLVTAKRIKLPMQTLNKQQKDIYIFNYADGFLILKQAT